MYSLDPKVRVQHENIMLSMVIPVPIKHEVDDSFPQPLIDELEILVGRDNNSGVKACDAYSQQEFDLRAHIVTVRGNGPAIAEAIGMKSLVVPKPHVDTALFGKAFVRGNKSTYYIPHRRCYTAL
jgi:hypothetical protein